MIIVVGGEMLITFFLRLYKQYNNKFKGKKQLNNVIVSGKLLNK